MSESPPQTKKMRIDIALMLAEKKVEDDKRQFEEANMNEILKIALGNHMSENHINPSEERDLRKSRGERLLQYFREQPLLSTTASARQTEKNRERAMIWENITKLINEEFGEGLDILTVDKVKKLLTYYKKKEDGKFDNIKPNDSGKELDDLSGTLGLLGNKSSDETYDTKMMSGFLPLVIPPSASSTTSLSSPPNKQYSNNSEKINELKKKRHDLVVSLAEFYLQRMCFDNASRSAAVNAERHNMWLKITNQVNEQFAADIGGLGVEQAKKLFSNTKRRNRMKNEREASTSSPDSDNWVSRMDSVEPEDVRKEQLVQIDPTSTSSILVSIEQVVQIENLRKTITERDLEIDRLKNLLKEQEVRHKNRIFELLDEIKTRVLNGI